MFGLFWQLFALFWELSPPYRKYRKERYTRR